MHATSHLGGIIVTNEHPTGEAEHHIVVLRELSGSPPRQRECEVSPHAPVCEHLLSGWCRSFRRLWDRPLRLQLEEVGLWIGRVLEVTAWSASSSSYLLPDPPRCDKLHCQFLLPPHPTPPRSHPPIPMNHSLEPVSHSKSFLP